MAEREVRIFAEGAVRHVQASGTGGWKTASAAATALVGFVQAGTNFDSAGRYAPVMERGMPHHHKFLGADFVEVEFTYLYGVTANMAEPATASGVSTKQTHFELKMDVDELGGGTAHYYQFMNGVRLSHGFTEQEEGNQLRERWRFLSMIGPTASGYIA